MPYMESKHLFFKLFLLLSSSASIVQSDDNCVYTIYIRTGSIFKGGTNSIISLELADAFGDGMTITDLEAWGGAMAPGHDYYERGNLDIFSGRGPCLNAPICAAKLTSNGTGPHHGWYCNYVEVTTTGPHVQCSKQLFTVQQWLARDAPPYSLTATRDYCVYDENLAGRRRAELKPVPVKLVGSSAM